MSRLRLAGVSKGYGSFVAVDKLDLDVEEGEFVTLLGPSGCGKTTTLRMIAGFVTPDSGDIWFDDRNMTYVPAHRRNTAMVFQSYALFPHMTVAENIAFGLKMRRLSATEQGQRINEALEMVSLQGLEKRRPGQLSGGQQQRVALARAIVTQPDILLFDEPLSNLDAKLREKVRVEIRDLQRRLGITTIYVTHDQAEALAVSDRVVVMNNGRIEQTGDPVDIYNTPKTAFVAHFLGAANIVEGKVVSRGMVETPIGTFDLGEKAGSLGRAIELCWRPEDMRVDAADAANIHGAIVKSIIFHGSFIELFVEKAGCSLRVHLNGASPSAFREGDSVNFLLPLDKIRVVA